MRHILVPSLALLTATLTAADHADALDKALAGVTPAPAAHAHAHDEGAHMRLTDLSLSVLGAVGASTATDDEIAGLQGGGHDPNRRGFTFQAAELSISGAVDPYFNAEAHIVALPGAIELEEAYLTTTSLPHGLEVRAGYQLIEFGRVNPSHAHSWAWIDQPVIASRLLGGDGSRAPGARVAWLAPLGWFSQVVVGAFNSDDGTEVSFRGVAEEDADPAVAPTIAGRMRQEAQDVHALADLVYLLRWENSLPFDRTEAKLGLSYLTGPNASGRGMRSDLYGADLTVGWKPATAGDIAFVKVTVEAMLRRAKMAAADYDPDGIPASLDEFSTPAETLSDWGGYAQVLVGFGERWSAGLRGEYATASGDSVLETLADHDADPLRDTRLRVSPLLQFHPSEFSRLRLQYDYDRAEHLEDGHAHSVWLGVEVLIGAHPAHGF